MEFCALPLAEAEGHVLGHNVVDEQGRRVLRKGRALCRADLGVLRALGYRRVYVARLGADDVDENRAADRMATVVAGRSIRASRARTGRVNLVAEALGVLRIDLPRLADLHGHEGVTLATLPQHSTVEAGAMVATLKVIPYALPAAQVARATAPTAGPLVWVDRLEPRRVALLLSGAAANRERIVRTYRNALEPRLRLLGAELVTTAFEATPPGAVPGAFGTDGSSGLARRLNALLDDGADLVILAGETAVMDRHDLAPRAIEAAGGEVVCFGAPVDPGNLLLLGQRGDTPILGAPGCARSPKRNIVDLLLPRLLVGERLTRHDILALAHGGLLEDVPERPLPRSWLT